MTELVIEAPHLQSNGQRGSAIVVLMVGWCLWLYFCFPFIELFGWVIGLPICSVWVNLSGGYLSLQNLLMVYAMTITGLVGAWSLWAGYNALKQRRRRLRETPLIGAAALCQAYGVAEESLALCRNSQNVTVRFDAAGNIVAMQGEPRRN